MNPEFYDPDDEELSGGYEHCPMCGCCKRDRYENCTECGHPHLLALNVNGSYERNWHGWVGVMNVPDIGMEYKFHNVVYKIVGTLGKHAVLFDRPLEQPLKDEFGDPV